MARIDWDRLRRVRALDGADVRVDTDGAHVWERPREDAGVPFGARRLRRGVILRRREERSKEAAPAASDDASIAQGQPAPGRSNERPLPPPPLRCRACGARISPRKLLRHARRCPASKSRER